MFVVDQVHPLSVAIMLRAKSLPAQGSLWIASEELAAAPSLPFYDRVQAALADAGFGETIRDLCAPYYVEDFGAPAIDPVVYFKMLLVGFMEGITSNRGLAARCADSLSVRRFLGYALTEDTPTHWSLGVIRDRLPEEVYRQALEATLAALQRKGVLKGKHLGVDSTTVEANAAMRKLRHRMTGQTYWQYVKKLAATAGVDPEDTDAVRRFDAKRPDKKMSNDDWEHPEDPDARIGQTKEKSTKMIYQQEHTVDMETGAIIDVQVRHADQGEAAGMAERVQDAERQMNHALGLPISNATADTITADKGYHKLEEITALHKKGYDTIIPEMKRTRDMEAMNAAQRRAYEANAKMVKSAKGKALLRKRGEKIERSFANTMNSAAMRRTTLRGLEKNRKRGLIGGIAANLCLLMRTLCGVGTVRQYLALPEGAWA